MFQKGREEKRGGGKLRKGNAIGNDESISRLTHFVR